MTIKLPKDAIYAQLTTLGVDVHYMSNDNDETPFPDIFPLITYYRITGKLVPGGKRSEMFQITSRAKTNLEAETLRNQVIDLLNHTRNGSEWERCVLQPYGADLKDPATGACGIPLTFTFIIKDFAM